MDIKEVSQRREDLEVEILRLLEDFIAETDALIDDVTVYFSHVRDPGKTRDRPVITGVRVDVRL